MERHQLNGSSVDFILAGNAVFTVENTETGNHYTFKVQQPKPTTPHFVKVLTGPNSEQDYTYLGTIFNGQDYSHGRKSSISPTATSEKVFQYIWPRILSHNLPPQVEVYHEGRCGRCGRTLTTPESVKRGIGPECIKIMEGH
jgi:hypothetical protein